MKLLPPSGPERWRAIGVLVVILVVAAIYVPGLLSTDAPPAGAPAAKSPNPPGLPGQTAAAGSASNPRGALSQGRKAGQDSPVPVDLAALEPKDEAAGPESGRNPFRFGEPPKPPPPPYVPPPPQPPPAPYVPPPPPAPTVKLTLIVTMLGPDGGKWIANFKDERQVQFTGSDGDVIDGRYRVIKVAEKSAVVAFLDGTGQKTLRIQ